MRYRRFEAADLPGVLTLQEANLFHALDETQRREGWLSVAFEPGQFTAMARDLALIVAHDGAGVQGYLCAAGNDAGVRVPLLASMLEHAARLGFLGRPLARQRTFVYGPVCVAQGQRRKGVLRGMYQRLRDELTGDFDAGVLFIAKGNAPSLHAHDALGASIVGDFRHDGRDYWILAFPIPQPRYC